VADPPLHHPAHPTAVPETIRITLFINPYGFSSESPEETKFASVGLGEDIALNLPQRVRVFAVLSDATNDKR
jgi:hypothetical protein